MKRAIRVFFLMHSAVTAEAVKPCGCGSCCGDWANGVGIDVSVGSGDDKEKF